MRISRTILIGICCFLFVAGASAQAQLTGFLHSAQPLEQGNTDAGAYFGLFNAERGSGTPLSVFGQVRHGLFNAGDGSLKFGLVDLDAGNDDVGVVLVGETQWGLLGPRWGDSFSLSFGPEVGVYDAAGVRVWSLGGNAAVSQAFLARGREIVLYSRLNVRLELVDYNAAKMDSDSDLKIGLNPGMMWEIGDLFDLVVELQIDDAFGFLVGMNFRM